MSMRRHFPYDAVRQPFLASQVPQDYDRVVPTPTRADFERLQAECAHLRADVEALKDLIRAASAEMKTQFTRIAQMQAVLDEERLADERKPDVPGLVAVPARRHS